MLIRADDRRKMIGLGVLSLLGLAVFVALALDVLNDGAVTSFDWRCAETFQQHAAEHPALLTSMRVITHIGGIPVMTGLAVAGTLVLLWRRDYVLALGFALTAGGGALFNQGVKGVIDRPRPPAVMRDAEVTETNESYPSGHSMGATIGYGSLAYVLGVLVIRGRGARLALVAALGLLIVAIGFSRMYLRAHWFSDVVGGFALGTFWLGLCVIAMEYRRRARLAAKPVATTTAAV
jgi:undecaprenyl-diphosphatase